MKDEVIFRYDGDLMLKFFVTEACKLLLVCKYCTSKAGIYFVAQAVSASCCKKTC